MTLNELNDRIQNSLERLGVDTDPFKDMILDFSKKVDFLAAAGRYSGLLKSISTWGGWEHVAGDAFEIHFAYAFESQAATLQREVKLLEGSDTSVDFQYQSETGQRVNLELGHIFEQSWIRDEQKKNSWEITLLSTVDKKNQTPLWESIYTQGKIRSKVQINKDGLIEPIKFPIPNVNMINGIVMDVTQLHLGMFDEDDAIEIICGAEHVPAHNRLGVFGMASQLPKNPSQAIQQAYKENTVFRERIHFVLFAWDKRRSQRYLDADHRYFFVVNPNLISEESARRLWREMGRFLIRDPNAVNALPGTSQ